MYLKSCIESWRDDNIVGFLVLVANKGFVKQMPIYSLLLFDYNVISNAIIILSPRITI